MLLRQLMITEKIITVKFIFKFFRQFSLLFFLKLLFLPDFFKKTFMFSQNAEGSHKLLIDAWVNDVTQCSQFIVKSLKF